MLPHVGSAQLESALLYHKLYPEEIDAEIEANDRAFDEGTRTGVVIHT